MSEPDYSRPAFAPHVNNQELVCRACYYGGPSGAHAPTKARMKARKAR